MRISKRDNKKAKKAPNSLKSISPSLSLYLWHSKSKENNEQPIAEDGVRLPEYKENQKGRKLGYLLILLFTLSEEKKAKAFKSREIDHEEIENGDKEEGIKKEIGILEWVMGMNRKADGFGVVSLNLY